MAEGDLQADTPVPETNDETATLMNCLSETVAHLKGVITDIDDHKFGVVYASDYKSETAHEL